ncbi:MAG TPA: hypothetical protein VIM77_02515, partial [Mucilaginibacter sp.]
KKSHRGKTDKRVLTTDKKITTKRQPTQNASSVKGNTFIVDSTAAVFTILDTTEIQRRHKASTGEEFYTGADDQMYYAAEAMTYPKKQPIKIINVDSRHRYLQFKRSNGSVLKIKLDTVAFITNLYFYNPQKEPYHVDMTDIDNEYKRYFNVK